MLPVRPEAGAEGERLSDRVFRWITEQIVTGELRPGQWISENEIALTLGVSRSPVNQALHSLAAEGLVKIVPRRGTLVADIDVRDASDLYHARALVDGEMVHLVTTSATDPDVRVLRGIVQDMKNAVGDHTAFFESTLRLWEALQTACPNQTIADLSRVLWRRSIRFRGFLLRVPGQEERVQQALREIIDLIEARDADGARRRTEELLHEHTGPRGALAGQVHV